MDFIKELRATTATAAGALAAGYAAYLAGVAVYRIWLSPLSHIPGPKLAALTKFYCLWYDV